GRGGGGGGGGRGWGGGGGAGARRGVVERAGLGLAGGDQLGERLVLGGRGDHHQRLLPERDHRREGGQRVVGQLGIERVRGCERAVGENGVAVCRRVGDRIGADRSAGARPILDHERAPDLAADLFHDDARHDVAS